MKALVIDYFEYQAKDVNCNHTEGNDAGIQEGDFKRRGLCVHLPAPQATYKGNIKKNEAVIQRRLVSGPLFHHVEPVKIPNEAHSGLVEPLPTWAVHEHRLAAPGTEEEKHPGANEVGEDKAGQDGGEEGDGRQPGEDEKEVPDEVDERRGDALYFFVGEEGAKGAVVRRHAEGNG